MTGDSRNDVLAAFGVGSDALLGRGGEASIYALDADRALRVLHRWGDVAQLRRNQGLLRGLVSTAVPFELPQILEIGEIGGRTYAVERRLPGRPLTEHLKTTGGGGRDRLIEAYLEAAQALGDLRPDGWPFYGELATARPVRADSWREFLTLGAARSLAAAGPPLDQVDAHGLALGLPECSRPEFVHLDAFAGNMLTDGVRITAVIDVGYTCVAGDRRLDPVAAAVYLEPRPSIAPIATAADAEIARSWLCSAGLLDLLDPARRWLAAYWAFALTTLPFSVVPVRPRANGMRGSKRRAIHRLGA